MSEATDRRRVEPITVGSPAAGAGFTHRVPGATVQKFLTVSFRMVNAAAVANRLVRVEFLDAAGAVFAAVGAPFKTTTGVTSRFTFGVGLNQYGADDAAQIGGPLPALELIGGLALRVAVANMNAGDQIDGAALFVEQTGVRE